MLAAYSWGNLPRVEQDVLPFDWRDQALPHGNTSLLPWGLGRSYGDSCVNELNAVLATSRLDRFVRFEPESGCITVESGVSLAQILELVVSHEWFLPVTPGTKFVTVGGAIANDVHGKNHHSAGSFGHWVESFELLRSDVGQITCSESENSDLYFATIGGLGLTGLILAATIRLKRIESEWIDCETLVFRSLAEFRALSEASSSDYEYTVAWFDCLSAKGAELKGIFSRGNHSASGDEERRTPKRRSKQVPIFFPKMAMNSMTVRGFNLAYFWKQRRQTGHSSIHYDEFLYPLDGLLNWNRIYGRDGFYQYQCVIPFENYEVIGLLLEEMTKARAGSFLAVLKEFGNKSSLGMLSFPRPGVTLALDFPNRGRKTLDLLDDLDVLVAGADGAIYPAKDARMSPSVFRGSFPLWRDFESFRDPVFSSSFWRRVTSEE